ncbi:MAG TPA: MFS transporter, partial [Pirellulales bacterium]|nr:MFS transporter [Pirellulales bacterium]
RIRYLVVFVATLCAVLLYVDRICISFVIGDIGSDLSLDQKQTKWVLSAFFFSYALAQVPAGWIGDRYGARGTMAVYILSWSLLTAALGLAQSLYALVLLRLGCGLAQAGAYPICASLVARWMPLSARGLASSVVSLGGRLGGAAAPTITGYLLPVVGSWRGVMLVYGLAGVPVAWLFVHWVRSVPRAHPRCNDAECELIGERPTSSAATDARGTVSWLTLASDQSMWLMSLALLTTNFGWAFLVTWLPTYLEQVYDVPTKTRGIMSSLPLFVGMSGGVIGGWLTDRMTMRLGVRWGRALPLALSRFAAAAAFVACLVIDDPWLATIAFIVVSFATDLGIGATWAFAQDVGGRSIGAVLGWSNMWGNLGAWLSPLLVESVLPSDGGDWSAAFAICALAFIVSGVASLGVRSDRPLARGDSALH